MQNIVGGGACFAGTAVASDLAAKLDSRYRVVLITPRSDSISLPVSPRLVVSESAELEQTTLVPLDRMFKKGNGEIKSIEPKDAQSAGDVLLDVGEHIPYEALVITSRYKWKAAIGGAVDIELASEVKGEPAYGFILCQVQ